MDKPNSLALPAHLYFVEVLIDGFWVGVNEAFYTPESAERERQFHMAKAVYSNVRVVQYQRVYA